ncbi:hypothetical protein LINPERPRIM_LOCUS29653, partial [Linum perenne]
KTEQANSPWFQKFNRWRLFCHWQQLLPVSTAPTPSSLLISLSSFVSNEHGRC